MIRRSRSYAAPQADVLGSRESSLDAAGMELKLLDLAKLVRTAQECQQQSDVLRDLQGQQLAAGLQVLQAQLQQLRSAVFATGPDESSQATATGAAAAAGASGAAPLALTMQRDSSTRPAPSGTAPVGMHGASSNGLHTSSGGQQCGQPALLLARRTELQALAERVEALGDTLQRSTAEARQADAAREQSEMLVLERLIALEGAAAGSRAAIAACSSEQQQTLEEVRHLASRVDALSSRVSSVLTWFDEDDDDALERGGRGDVGFADGGSPTASTSGGLGARCHRSGGSLVDQEEEEDWLYTEAAAPRVGRTSRSTRLGSGDTGKGAALSSGVHGLPSDPGGPLPPGPGPGPGQGQSTGRRGRFVSTGPPPLPPRLQASVNRTVQAAVVEVMETWEVRAAAQRESEAVRMGAMLEVVQGISLAQQAMTAPLERLAALCPRLMDVLHILDASAGAADCTVPEPAWAQARTAAVAHSLGTSRAAAAGAVGADPYTAGYLGGSSADGGSSAEGDWRAGRLGRPAVHSMPLAAERPMGRGELLEGAYVMAAEAGGLVEGMQQTLAEAMTLGQGRSARSAQHPSGRHHVQHPDKPDVLRDASNGLSHARPSPKAGSDRKRRPCEAAAQSQAPIDTVSTHAAAPPHAGAYPLPTLPLPGHSQLPSAARAGGSVPSEQSPPDPHAATCIPVALAPCPSTAAGASSSVSVVSLADLAPPSATAGRAPSSAAARTPARASSPSSPRHHPRSASPQPATPRTVQGAERVSPNRAALAARGANPAALAVAGGRATSPQGAPATAGAAAPWVLPEGVRTLYLNAKLAAQLGEVLRGVATSASVLEAGTAAAAESWLLAGPPSTSEAGAGGGGAPGGGQGGARRAGRGGNGPSVTPRQAALQHSVQDGGSGLRRAGVTGAETTQTAHSGGVLKPAHADGVKSVPPLVDELTDSAFGTATRVRAPPPPSSYDSFYSPRSIALAGLQRGGRRHSADSALEKRGRSQSPHGRVRRGSSGGSSEATEDEVGDEEDGGSKWGWLSEDEDAGTQADRTVHVAASKRQGRGSIAGAEEWADRVVASGRRRSAASAESPRPGEGAHARAAKRGTPSVTGQLRLARTAGRPPPAPRAVSPVLQPAIGKKVGTRGKLVRRAAPAPEAVVTTPRSSSVAAIRRGSSVRTPSPRSGRESPLRRAADRGPAYAAATASANARGAVRRALSPRGSAGGAASRAVGTVAAGLAKARVANGRSSGGGQGDGGERLANKASVSSGGNSGRGSNSIGGSGRGSNSVGDSPGGRGSSGAWGSGGDSSGAGGAGRVRRPTDMVPTESSRDLLSYRQILASLQRI